MLFSEKENLLELYNAVNGTHYENSELLEINTLENAIYMSMQNDVSFIIDSRLSLYEHQSTYSPNLPLRFLLYVADLYSPIASKENLYGSKLVQIAPPQFLIFYNGQEEQPERLELKLSDAFKVKDTEPSLELRATMLNINMGKNKALMKASRTLWGYAEYTRRVREYAKDKTLEEAVEQAITECIREDILRDFLTKHRAEAKKMSIYEYDEEKHMRQTREEGYEEGKIKMAAQTIFDFLSMKGKIPDSLLNKVKEEQDLEILRKYITLAATVETVGQFEQKISREACTCLAVPHRAEAKKMSIYEYDEEKHMRQTREEGYEEGRLSGKAESILEFLQDLGPVSEELAGKIRSEQDLDQLSRWLKLSARAKSVEAFAAAIQND